MYKTTLRSRAGFTLIELLTVIAIIGILAAILFPAIGAAKKAAQKANDLSSLKSIGQASFIFAQDSKDQFPGTKISTTSATFGQNDSAAGTTATTKIVAQALAKAGLESAASWISKADTTTTKDAENAAVSTILGDDKASARSTFTAANLAFGYIAGLNSSYSATTPLAYSRGIVSSADGKWSASTAPYGSDGGYVLFVGGNVSYLKNLGTTTAGELTNSSGATSNKITDTIKSTKTVLFLEEDNSGVSSSGAPTGS